MIVKRYAKDNNNNENTERNEEEFNCLHVIKCKKSIVAWLVSDIVGENRHPKL